MDLKIAIASGKGGTGKTFISTNLFRTLEKQNEHITLIDCDAEEPNVLQFLSGEIVNESKVLQYIPEINTKNCTDCGKCYEYCNYNALLFLKERKYIKVIEDQCHGCGACTVACKFNAITEKEDELGVITKLKTSENACIIEGRTHVGVHSPVSTIKASIKKANNGVVILDSPPGTSCPFIQTAAQADIVILVTEPTPFGLSDLKQAIETLKTINKCYAVVVNKTGLGSNEIYEYLQHENIELLMQIPFDKHIALSYSKGEILVDSNEEWQLKFNDLYNSIVKKYGNCGN